MAIEPAALLAEIEADPKHLGYKALSDEGMVALLNTTGASSETCTPAPYSGLALGALLDFGEINDTTKVSAFGQTLLLKLMDEPIDLANAPVLSNLQKILAACPNSLAALNAAAGPQPCSRAEALFGRGMQITLDELLPAKWLNGGHW